MSSDYFVPHFGRSIVIIPSSCRIMHLFTQLTIEHEMIGLNCPAASPDLIQIEICEMTSINKYVVII